MPSLSRLWFCSTRIPRKPKADHGLLWRRCRYDKLRWRREREKEKEKEKEKERRKRMEEEEEEEEHIKTCMKFGQICSIQNAHVMYS